MSLLLIKYGELSTKKDNRGFFINTLKRNITSSLNGLNFSIKSDYARMFIEVEEEEEAIKRLKKIYGIYKIASCFKLKTNLLEDIKKELLNLIKDKKFTTFKIETKRSLKTYPIKSMEMSSLLGTYILENLKETKVDLNNFQYLITLEIRNEGTFIYFDEIEGLKGYPVGTLGKALMMLSGGIDSPVASYLALKRGISLSYIYFESFPHTSIEAKQKVIDLANIVSQYGVNTTLYVVNFTAIQELIYKQVPEEYNITILRRMMYRISELVSNKYNFLAIVNGENIGQVASQTLTSMKVINEIISIPVLRPLATYDKEEIINLSKKIGTYEISILPYEDCCTIFLPKRPVINPKSKLANNYENNFEYNNLLKEAVDTIEEIKIGVKTDNKTKKQYL